MPNTVTRIRAMNQNASDGLEVPAGMAGSTRRAISS
jgi:hypothetical protein